MLRTCLLTALVAVANAGGSSFNITLQDASRGGRTVTTLVCKSPNSDLQNLVLFAHGGGLFAEDYNYLCAFSPPGTIMARLISPVADSPMDLKPMAADMSFLAFELLQQSRDNSASPLYKQLNGRVVLSGHSMGGAAAIIAGGSRGMAEAGVVGVASFAPGFWMEEQTKLLTAGGCSLGKLPFLLVAGEHDCANSLAAQARPIWSNVTAPACANETTGPRFLVDLKAATHCQWTVPVKGSCDFDKPCSTPHVGREEQQNLGIQLLQTLFDGDLESFLAAKQNVAWSYVTGASPPGDVAGLPSSCPCGTVSTVVI